MNDSHFSTPRPTTFALLTIAAIGPVLYPAWLAWRTRAVEPPVPPEPEDWPGVTVVLPAYRERLVIADKVRNVLENGYPGPLEVLVVAEDPETASAAAATPARVIGDTERRGKALALNAGVRNATQPIVVFSDANAMLVPGALARAVRWLSDPAVGAVAGEKRIAGESLYWEFESWLKRREHMTGTTIGAGGELIASRRDEFVELPSDTAVDDLWFALDVVERGQRVAYAADARVYEDGSGSVAEEWERRTRIVSGVIDALWRRRHLLAPGPHGVAAQLWGHRLVRSSAGPLAHAVLVLRAIPSARSSTLARLFLGIHAVGAVALLRQARGERTGRVSGAIAQVLFLQAAGIGGTLRWARGDRPTVWPKPERRRPGGEPLLDAPNGDGP